MKNIMQVTISEMTLDDLDEVLAIENQSYPTPWSRRAFESELKHNLYAHYFVARHEEEIVGYFGMWVILDEAHITNICVNPKYRRQGIGEQMLRFAFDKAKELGASQMTLEVRVSNHAAQNLYRKLGFEERGIRKGYYTDNNEDALIMTKDDLGPGRPQSEQVKWML
ncbi:MAG TPA: ribosomal protein S18-alanine N-acetyltransferase [Bacillota bacterium]|nr:ribosomal protein S18-alanine N-acetyltransferase [Candidatus Fermentithermobacillaceae bacterium]HOB30232.1 ribosomal protein S18-alanine N-acetyltransferase [Bacillota bacterium]HOK64159.1 ribosomal protein S18-alanine N-acetyltransferase [Bacillota bacterium]HOL11668.1 ribosomal protein S18-alanine N-acetyltransferase [Bacillota bacterium]HOQ02796.1 ribosomal protein S18-alanine N-acetyltransferase [Bacillota bacterium]